MRAEIRHLFSDIAAWLFVVTLCSALGFVIGTIVRRAYVVIFG